MARGGNDYSRISEDDDSPQRRSLRRSARCFTGRADRRSALRLYLLSLAYLALLFCAMVADVHI